MTNRQLFILFLFAVGVAALFGAWWIAAVGPVFDNVNFNAWLAAGGFFGLAAFLVERLPAKGARA